jgi:hypothetical protein
MAPVEASARRLLIRSAALPVRAEADLVVIRGLPYVDAKPGSQPARYSKGRGVGSIRNDQP